jgi:hypothetical protein
MRAEEQGYMEDKDQEPFMISAVRSTLTRLGARLSPSSMYWVERVMSQLAVGHWFRQQGFQPRPLYANRRQLYTALARSIAEERALYLEFGVYQGASLREWSRLLKNPCAELHGFDKFIGLPERWNAYNPKGMFNGAVNPQAVAERIQDRRVTLHVGWFHETLPEFSLPAQERLIVNFDADLYSSTKYALDWLRDAIHPGSILIFDEFYDHMHELRAFDEFLAASGMRFRFLGGATSLSQCAFERIA